MITLFLLLLALILFLVAAFLPATRPNLVALGLASLTGSLITQTFGV